MNAYDWQKRLGDTFHTHGVVGANLLPIIEAERVFDLQVEQRFKGFATLNTAFQSFILETLDDTSKKAARLGAKPPYAWYRPAVLSFVGTFKLLRSSDRLFRSGYPLNGYALLRDLKDHALAYGAILNGLTTLEKVNGWDAAKAEPPESYNWEHARKARNARKKTDSEILSRMVWKQSGFSAEVQEQLIRWNEMFHQEVHGGRLTFAVEGSDWLFGSAPLPVFPFASDKATSLGMFINRFEEVAWMLLRSICYLQPRIMPFVDEWRTKWNILDDSLRMVHEDAVKINRVGASEIIELVRVKFDFSPEEAFYTEASPAGAVG